MEYLKKKWFVAKTYEIEGVQSATVDYCISRLIDKRILCVDVETCAKHQFRHHKQGGLSPYLSKVVMLQIGTDEDLFAIDVRDFSKKDLRELFLILENEKYLKVGQNIKFDYQMIKTSFGVELVNIADTMIIDMLIFLGKNVGFSLEKLAKRYLGVSYSKSGQLDMFVPTISSNLTKETRKQFKLIGKKPFTEEQVVYGLMDVDFTYQIYMHQLVKVAEEGLSRAVTLENSFTTVLAELELAGFHLDTDMWEKLYQENLENLEKARKKLVRMTKKSGSQFYNFQTSLFEEDEVEINFNSSRQVVELCKALGIPTEVKDKKRSTELGLDITKDSVEEKHLRKYIKEFPIIAAYLEYKKLEKAVSTYGHKFLEDFVNPRSKRVQSNFRQLVNSSRLASRNPNLQNIPAPRKMKGFRRCFRAGSEDRILVVSDYSQQESRILAELAQEDNLIHFFNTGDGDLHSHTARLMFKVPVDSKTNTHLRELAKILNFG